MVDVAHHGDDRRARALRLLVILVVVGEQGLELDLLLLARVDEQDLGADVVGKQLDHLVGQRLGGRDHLALLKQEEHDVGGRAVQLGADVLGARPPLDDDLALRDGCVGAGVAGGLGGLDLLQTPPPAAPRRSGPGPAGTTASARTPARTAAGAAGEATGPAAGATGEATTGRTAGTATATAGPAAGTTGEAARTGTRAGTTGASRAGGTAGGRWTPPALAGRRRDGLAAR